MDEFLRLLDGVDACIFSGDSMQDPKNRDALLEHIQRWGRNLLVEAQFDAPKQRSVTKTDLLEYALEGANTQRGLNTGNPDWTPNEFVQLDEHIEELRIRCKIRRLKDTLREYRRFNEQRNRT